MSKLNPVWWVSQIVEGAALLWCMACGALALVGWAVLCACVHIRGDSKDTKLICGCSGKTVCATHRWLG